MNALTIKNLKKTYNQNRVKALNGVNLEIKKGDLFGLIGPNGAGKTTVIGIITDLIKKDEGSVIIFDKDIDKEFSHAKSYIGVVPQEFNFGLFEKVYDIVLNQAGYYGIPPNTARDRVARYLKQLDLWEKRNTIARQLSGGMKRRLMIARSLVHNPRILFLDEPTAGVDVELRRLTWDFLLDLNQQGTTIVLTTHYLEEAEYLCNNIAIINKGAIIENLPKKELVRKLDKQVFVFDLKQPTKIREVNGLILRQIDDVTVEAEISGHETMNPVFDYFMQQRIDIISMKNKTNRLEESFINILKTGETL